MLDDVIRRYFSQPADLPSTLAHALSLQTPKESVRVFALTDLDHNLHFAERWLILTDRSFIIAHVQDNSSVWQLRTIPLSEIDRFELMEGLTSSRLHIVGTDAELKGSVHFTRRQSRAVGNLQFAAEQLKKKLSGESAQELASNLDASAEYQEAVFQPVKDARATLSMPKMGIMMRLFSYMKPHKKAVGVGFGLAVVLTALQLLPPYLTRVLVDDVLRPVEKGTLQQTTTWLWLIIAALGGVWGIGELFSFLRLRIMALTGEKISMKLRDDLYSHMQKMSLSFFGAKPTGSLITRVSSDTDRLWDFITFGFIDIGISVLQIVGVAIALIVQDRSLGLLVLTPLPIMTLMFYLHSRKTQVLFLRIWRKWASMTSVLSDALSGIRVVKAFAQEKYETERFSEKNRAVQHEAETLHRHWTRFWPTVVMLMHTCTLIVWVIGAPRVMRYIMTGGAEGMPLGLFIAFTGYMWMFWAPVQHLGMMSRTINRVTSSASRVFEVLDTVPSIENKPNAIVNSHIDGSIEFENVTFSYDGIRNVLKGVSFKVHPGEMIGLVGPSGGGKTTLVNLICRFYDVKAGSVKIDGADVRDLELSTLRRQIGVVLQEPYLFHGTIAENISYGSENASSRDIIEAARAANAHEFICGFPDGYETMVGERGQTLSGGERQRISIARAILHNPRILILDEATSSVDTETEKRIQEALERLIAGRTTFAIAHRLSTLSRADRLFVLEEGRLAEHGTHDELLSKPEGIYAKLHKTQLELHATIAI